MWKVHFRKAFKVKFPADNRDRLYKSRELIEAIQKDS